MGHEPATLRQNSSVQLEHGSGVAVRRGVDQDGTVHGIKSLRIVDASLMPTITNGNTNSPTIMIAEKISDMILNKDSLPDQDVKIFDPK